MRTRRRWEFGATFVLATVLLLSTAGSVAAFKTGGYVTKIKNLSAPAGDTAGGKLSCPSGKKLVSGGAFWFAPGEGLTTDIMRYTRLGASLPLNSKTWYASGFNGTDGAATLEIIVHCLASAQVGSYAINVTQYPAGFAGITGGYVACPVGQRIVTGGAGWRIQGDPFVKSMAVSNQLSSSSPTLQADGWYGAGYGTNHQAVLQTVALCRPSSAVGTYSTKYVSYDTSTQTNVGNYLSCDSGKRVVAMGSFWHEKNQSPDPALSDRYRLAASTPTSDKKGMYGSGRAFETTAELTLVVHCRPR